MTPGLDRRAFLKLLGGGIIVLVRLRPSGVWAQGRGYPTDINAYLRIGENGRVTVFSGKIEMGQGVMTSLAQMAAEDLGVSLDSIEMILGDTDRCPWDMGTFGSLTTRMFGPALRTAAAEARQVLMELAAKQLGAPGGRLVVERGVVSVKGEPNRKVSYGDLARGKTIARTVDEKAVLRAVPEFTVMGRSPNRLDGVDKVTGAGRYAGDIRLPGLLHARILRPPAHGATLAGVDTSEAAKLEGVAVVNQDGLVAVLHADPELAEAALARLRPEWNAAPPGADTESIFDDLLRRVPEPQVSGGGRGDVEAARAAATRRFESTYQKGYVAHAPLEPHVSTASFEGGKLTVWASTQTPFPTRDRLAQGLSLDPKNVRVLTPYVGGGFGGKSAGRQSEEAARLAKITGRPVQVAFTRAEEFFYDTFDPACIVKITSALDGEGKINLWDYDVYFAGDRAAELFYDVPNVRMRVFGGWRGAGTDAHRFGVGPWRAPGANMNVFARESQIDVMAAAAGVDPVEFRLRNLSDQRMRRVLQEAAKAFGWKPAAGPSRRGWGVACGIDSGTYATLAVEVKVDQASGAVRVERVVCAQDMGVVVSPDGATMQVEGSITMGLGYVLREEVQIRDGRVLDENFDTYELPRFSWLPRIETVLVKNDALAPQGGGEPAIVPMGAAIANAVFDATGVRLFRLPMTPPRVKAAIAGTAPAGR
ncbi:MAG TPA: molybdopterin cofactor-binding domain-containing protein [Vicinamibacteria bacterium]|nr:molybdopterin cofactor-binding domain-containing protein [Vicinamibacteria bacterium]